MNIAIMMPESNGCSPLQEKMHDSVQSSGPCRSRVPEGGRGVWQVMRKAFAVPLQQGRGAGNVPPEPAGKVRIPEDRPE
jgi:hypothetical protein